MIHLSCSQYRRLDKIKNNDTYSTEDVLNPFSFFFFSHWILYQIQAWDSSVIDLLIMVTAPRHLIHA